MNKTRLQALYDAGYKDIDSLKNATIFDLMEVDDINPSLARRIMEKINPQNVIYSESPKIITFEQKNELIDDRVIEFEEDPGKLLNRFRPTKIVRAFSYVYLFLMILVIGSFIFFLIIIFSGPYLSGGYWIIFLIIWMSFIIFPITTFIEFKSVNSDILRIYENGIVIAGRREGIFLDPPKSELGLIFCPIWQRRYEYCYIPYTKIREIYSINSLNRTIALVLIDSYNKWYSFNLYHLSRKHFGKNTIIESLKTVLRNDWDRIYIGEF